MNIAILGYAVDGISSAVYWHNKGADITICDQKTDITIPEFAKPKLGPDYLSNLDQFDLLVRTPGLHPREIVTANPETPNILDKVTTAINEFFTQCPAPIIGVTGTKGKGTTCTLIYKILQTAGKKAFLGGNIGTVPLDFLPLVTSDSWVVLELSNFQLIDIKSSPKIAVCLMIVPEHQDWHKSNKEYFNAKQNLFAFQIPEDITVFNARNLVAKQITTVSRGVKIPYIVPDTEHPLIEKKGAYVDGTTVFMDSIPVCELSDVALLGRHNLDNVCAAIATVWRIINRNTTIIKQAVQEFCGLEHRLEFVRELGGVRYYNDSFATTPEATIAAIRSFTQPKIVILGGSDKGIPFYDLVSEVVHNNVKQAIIIGETGEKIIELLVSRGFEDITLGGSNMQEMVQTAKDIAEPGDVVLLSTACASFGMFKNYKDRGDQYKMAVNQL